MVSGVFDWLSLSPAQAANIGAGALLLLSVLDLATARDTVPLNTPREWAIWLTQWRSKKPALPLSGAAVPYIFAVLLGHFFHPGWSPVVGPGGFFGLGVSAALALCLSVLGYFGKLGGGERALPWLVVAGFVTGIAIWPVGV